MRVILYTGKGGVGKTTIAAATACRLAAAGKRVLIMSTDQAHSLSDSYGVKLGKEPRRITGNLDGMEVDVVYESEKSWGSLKSYLKEMLTMKGSGGIEVEELLVFPGMEELFSMFRILEMKETGEYEVLVVDCAPTGETLSLLKYPQMFSEFIRKVLPVKRKGVKVAGPAVEKLLKIPMPDEGVFDDIEFLMDKMERLYQLMMDKEVFSLRIVTTPEKIVIKESKRNFTCLHLYDFNVDAVIVNRIYPQSAMEGYFGKWIQSQEEGLMEIAEGFSEVPRFYLELQKGEICGLDALERTGNLLFAETDPAKVLFCQKIYELENTDKGTVLKILLPFAEKGELELKQMENELLVGVKNERRKFPLPLELREKEAAGAKFEEGYLKISFV